MSFGCSCTCGKVLVFSTEVFTTCAYWLPDTLSCDNQRHTLLHTDLSCIIALHNPLIKEKLGNSDSQFWHPLHGGGSNFSVAFQKMTVAGSWSPILPEDHFRTYNNFVQNLLILVLHRTP